MRSWARGSVLARRGLFAVPELDSACCFGVLVGVFFDPHGVVSVWFARWPFGFWNWACFVSRLPLLEILGAQVQLKSEGVHEYFDVFREYVAVASFGHLFVVIPSVVVKL